MRKSYEDFIYDWTGKLIQVIGIGGAILSAFADALRARPFELGWWQIVAIGGFLLIWIWGVKAEEVLKTTKEILEK